MLLTEQQVADQFGVTRHAVRKWRREGKIGFIRINNTVRFEQSAVDDLIEAGRRQPVCIKCNTPIDLDRKEVPVAEVA